MTLIQTLDSARYNIFLGLPREPSLALGRDQLTTVIELLEKGYGPDDDIDSLVTGYPMGGMPEKDYRVCDQAAHKHSAARSPANAGRRD